MVDRVMVSIGTCPGNSPFHQPGPPPGPVFPFSSLPAFIITHPDCLPEHRWPQAQLPPQPEEGSITHTFMVLQTPTVALGAVEGWNPGVGVGGLALCSFCFQRLPLQVTGWLALCRVAGETVAGVCPVQGAVWVHLTSNPSPAASCPTSLLEAFLPLV